jgi:hypothetical protein
MPESNRIVAVILEVQDVDRSSGLYRDAFGIDLQPGDDNEVAGDRWLSGRHAAYSWYAGAYLHFALYQAKTNQGTSLAQIGFAVQDIAAATCPRPRRGRHDAASAAPRTLGRHRPLPGLRRQRREPDANAVITRLFGELWKCRNSD